MNHSNESCHILQRVMSHFWGNESCPHLLSLARSCLHHFPRRRNICLHLSNIFLHLTTRVGHVTVQVSVGHVTFQNAQNESRHIPFFHFFPPASQQRPNNHFQCQNGSCYISKMPKISHVTFFFLHFSWPASWQCPSLSA